MADYKVKNISAVQFVVASTPWPTGVAEDTASISGYSYTLPSGQKAPIFPGDYIVGSTIWRQDAFEAVYEPA